MARSKAPKNLEVDGTSKLAARSKPTDKHEKASLNIEEATVASPRPSRKRAGDYFDFEGEDSGEELLKDKSDAPNIGNPKKKAKTADSEKVESRSKDEAKSNAKNKKSKSSKRGTVNVESEETEEVVKPVKVKERRADKAKGKKKDEKKEQLPEDDDQAVEPVPSVAASKLKGRPKKTKTVSGGDAIRPVDIESNVAMDDGPFASLMEKEQGKHVGAGVGEPAASAETTGGRKSAKTAAKNVESSNANSAKDASTEDVTKMGTTVNKGAKYAIEKAKKTAKDKAPIDGKAKKVADNIEDKVDEGIEKVKKAGRTKVPTEKAAQAAENIKQGIEGVAEKPKKASKSKTLLTKAPAGVVDAARKEVKTAAKNAKNAAEPKDSKKGGKKDVPVKHKDAIRKTPSATEQSKPEASKSKKRKAPSGDTETVKTDLLDPLTEHAGVSAVKKQKKDAKSKSLGDAVGDLLFSAAEGANAARASLGGLASSLMGAATEDAEASAETAKTAAKEVKGKGKIMAEDITESIGKASTAVSEAIAGTDEVTSDSDVETDDHTAALLEGFESEGDEAPNAGPSFKEGQEIPQIPDAKTVAKKVKNIKTVNNEGPGVIYVGRIPHGFYEHQMRQYFSQFGDVNRLRLSRNSKTGTSRHYAFIEFKSTSVAKIAAETMDNYLMFEHILKCKIVQPEQLHEDVWKGANKRFKKVPWNKLEGRKHEMAVGRDQWKIRNENEEKRRQSKKEKLKEIGYEFEAPPLKSVDEVPVKDKTTEQEQSLVTTGQGDGTGSLNVSEEVKTKEVTKTSKFKVKEAITAAIKKTKRTLKDGEETTTTKVKKAKRAKGGEA